MLQMPSIPHFNDKSVGYVIGCHGYLGAELIQSSVTGSILLRGSLCVKLPIEMM